jgi:hypothetical protein
MSKLERWLTLVANLSVVAGIVFLAAELRQNTAAIRAQTRDSITEKQMEYLGWQATSPELSAAMYEARDAGTVQGLTPAEQGQVVGWLGGQFREWENSYYQYERGLFTPEEFEARYARWRGLLARSDSEGALYRGFWGAARSEFAPSFRAEIDRIVAEVEQAE